MRYIVPIVEQLDRAATELEDGSPVSNRVSLILTDNAVELMIHKRCEIKFDEYASSRRGAIRYSRSARHRVLGPHFDQKLRFLRAEGDLTDGEYNFVRVCHHFRNEAYHAGLIREDIFFPLAWEYHSLACDLFSRWPPNTRSSQPARDPPIGERFKKHLKTASSGLKASDPLAVDTVALARSLDGSRPQLTETLSAALAVSMRVAIEQVMEQMEFLVSEDPNQRSKAELLREVQYSADLFDVIPLEIDEGTDQYGQYILSKSADMEESWRPREDSLPIESWLGRVERLRQADRYSSLQRYEQLSNEMDYLRNAIEQAAFTLDSHIQSQVDGYLEERAFNKT